MTLYGVSRIGCKSTLLPTLTSIVNLSLQSACMPGQLKEAMVRPKLKKESLDFQEYSNFRTISNLKFVSKIIERAVAVQVKNYITDNDLDESLQSAYKHLQSTETALVKVQNDILCAIDGNKCVALLLLDMSSAFDTVEHRLFLDRLCNRLGSRGQVLEWFEPNLHNGKQYVMIDGVKSHVKDLQFGVSQGSVFRPILYSLNRNPYVIHDDILKYKTCTKTFLFKENFDYSSVRNIAKRILISILIFRYEFLTCTFIYLCFIIDVIF